MTNRLCEVSGDGRDCPPRDGLVGYYPLGNGRGASRGLVGQAAHDHAHLGHETRRFAGKERPKKVGTTLEQAANGRRSKGDKDARHTENRWH